jgi:glycerophosphoryl diester phosphodiesterase
MNCQNLYILYFLTFTMTSCTLTKEPLIIGHRGAKGHIAENTLPSIAKAIELGVDGIEIDIFKCASGELVVFHDKTLEKLTNTSGYVEELDLDSIKRIDLLNGYTIPTLNEVLDLINGQVFLNIELKGSSTAKKTSELLRTYFKSKTWSPEKIIISSFDWDELKIFRQNNDEVPIAILTEDDPLDAIPIGLHLKAIALNPDFKTLNQKNVEKIHKAGFKIFPWTVNKIEDLIAIKNLGVDGIITDFPERIPKSNN